MQRAACPDICRRISSPSVCRRPSPSFPASVHPAQAVSPILLFQLPFFRKHPSLLLAQHGRAAHAGWARVCGLWDRYIRIRKASINGIRRKSWIPHPLQCPEPLCASQALLFPQKGSKQLGRGGGRKQKEPHPRPESNH